MVKHLYHECMSLEELLEESVNTLGPDARDILAQVRWAPLRSCFTLITPEHNLAELLNLLLVATVFNKSTLFAGSTSRRRSMLQRTRHPPWVKGLLWQQSAAKPATIGVLAQTWERSCRHHSD